MKQQAHEIASWGNNVFVKIPITNTLGISTSSVIKNLVKDGVKLNVTALMTSEQVRLVAGVLDPNVPSYISVFAGRIADTGRNPEPIMVDAINLLRNNKNAEIIWASPRELLNIFQADQIGCHVITATHEILNKLELVGHDLNNYSLETVRMFRRDAIASKYWI